MPRSIKISVTQEDIDRAIRNNSSRCVVAQAIARQLPWAHHISVDVQTVRFTDKEGTRRVYLTPQAAEAYVIAFDAGDPIEPFSFGLYDSQRVNVNRRPLTEAGKKKEAARNAENYAKKKLAAAATRAQKTAAKKAAAAAAERVATVAAETAGQPLQTSAKPEPDPEIITKPRGVRKGAASNERHYGHRTLRINQNITPPNA